MPEELSVQTCDDRSARYSLGVFVNTQTELPSAQRAVQSFKNGSCLNLAQTEPWQNITFLAPDLFFNNSGAAGNSTNTTKLSMRSDRLGRKLSARSDCSTAKVQSGDTCKIAPHYHLKDVKLPGVHLKLNPTPDSLPLQKDRNQRRTNISINRCYACC